MDLEIGDGTAQITKMIIARDKLAASEDIVGPNRTSQDRVSFSSYPLATFLLG